jgi:predicted amidohydrolase YtcJ
MIRSLNLAAAAFALAAGAAPAQEAADTIYSGGAILTMADSAPRAEAVAVRDGRILAVGPAAAVMAHQGAGTRMVDLDGRTLLPGFVDAHGHVLQVGVQALVANLMAPPDGGVDSIAALQDALRAWAAEYPDRVDRLQAIVGFGYDDSQLDEQRHPTRADLDAVSTDLPVYVIHQSGHIGAANGRALDVAGITADSAEMPGGVIRREADGRTPDGVLEETPHFASLLKVLQHIGPAEAEAMFAAGTELATSFGYTTAQEGRAMPQLVDLMAGVANAGGLKIDVVAYPDILVDRDFILGSRSDSYDNRFRVAGAKLTIDGSPQGFTAWRDRPYYAPPEQYRADYAGYPAASADQVFDAVDWAFANGVQLLTHSNGEAATDLLLAAVATATAKHGPADRRNVLIHGQFMREDQVDGIKALDLFPSLFPMHTFYWGDWHRERTVGPASADNISPTGWLVRRGMKFSSHHDAPVAFPDSMRILDATVTRRSRSGDIIGPDQRVDVMTALKAMTIWPAFQHFEDDSKGSIEPGKLADFVILSADPTAVDPETLNGIKVVETIKEDVTVYRRAAE